MTVVSVQAPEGAESSFAATVAQELPDADERDDPEALPGTWGIDDRALHLLPTIGHVGRYALKHQLGSGGLGTVHAAFDPLLSRAIAIKTLHVQADAADDGRAAHRHAREMQLLAEARTAAGLNHPNIVTIHDAGLTEQGVYIAMEKLHGRDLRELLADGWRPEPAQAVRIAKRLADALAYAHSRGVVHCDVKPANIYMVGRTQPKLLDFGIARVARAVQNGALAPDVALEPHREGRDLGSPYYVAPEQLLGGVRPALRRVRRGRGAVRIARRPTCLRGPLPRRDSSRRAARRRSTGAQHQPAGRCRALIDRRASDGA